MSYKISQNDIELCGQPDQERFSILVGRHSKHGSAKQHTVALVELGEGLSSDPHFHAEREESYYFLSGEGFAKMGESEYPVKQGDLLFASPGERHQFFNRSKGPLKYLVITAPSWIPEDSFK